MKAGQEYLESSRDESSISPALSISPYALSAWKRVVDVLLAVGGLVVSAPVWLFISLAIWLDSGWPILYTQYRVGQKGRPFRLYKFRSMVPNAEREGSAVLASEHDPRVTRVGKLLRDTALDELPQLINILLGHMSWVGPRPERPEIINAITATCPDFALRTAVRPGLTGTAQVYGHYASPPGDKLAYDLEYIRTASLALDARLILKSFILTFTRKWQQRTDHFSG